MKSVVQKALDAFCSEKLEQKQQEVLISAESSPASERVVGKGLFGASVSIRHFKSQSICFPWNRQVELEQWLELTVHKERFYFILKG